MMNGQHCTPQHDTSPKPVTIRGVKYPSYAAAGRALGLSASTVLIADRRGTLDNVGLGSKNKGPRPKEITIRGVTYPSTREAAKALGVSYEAVRKAAQTGRLDTVGFGRGRKVTVAPPDAEWLRQQPKDAQQWRDAGWAAAGDIRPRVGAELVPNKPDGDGALPESLIAPRRPEPSPGVFVRAWRWLFGG